MKTIKKPEDLASPNAEDRFWSKVDRSGGPEACWLWTGGVSPSGYGQISLKGPDGGWSTYAAHRVSWMLHTGSMPETGLVVRHFVCRTPSCCNPSHLLSGTPQDNVDDMVRDGTQARGERSGVAKLTEQDVLDIRSVPASNGVSTALAKQYGLRQSTVSQIRSGQRWAHIGGERVTVERRVLTEDEIREIRETPRRMGAFKALAEKFGVSCEVVREARRSARFDNLVAAPADRHHKLTPEDVAGIRADPLGQGAIIRLARQYGVSRVTISQVIKGERHGDLPGARPGPIHCKMTPEQLMAIRREPQRHGVVSELSRKYGLTRAAVHRIRTSDKLRHLDQ